MTTFTYLQDAGVSRLHLLFDGDIGRGLPLVQKFSGQRPTTTALVRGRAGTGKSTLALALARHFAEGRTLLVLTTEIAPVDTTNKLAQLAAADPFSHEMQVQVEHLQARATTKHGELDAPANRVEASLREVVAMVRERADDTTPVGCVVVDAFALAGASPDSSLRGVLLEVLNFLEARGICVVLVAEAETDPWTEYLVDLVFELDWRRDEDSGANYRVLGLPKSRYVSASPGPYPYDFDPEKPGKPRVVPHLPDVVHRIEPRVGGRLFEGGWSVGLTHQHPLEPFLAKRAAWFKPSYVQPDPAFVRRWSFPLPPALAITSLNNIQDRPGEWAFYDCIAAHVRAGTTVVVGGEVRPQRLPLSWETPPARQPGSGVSTGWPARQFHTQGPGPDAFEAGNQEALRRLCDGAANHETARQQIVCALALGQHERAREIWQQAGSDGNLNAVLEKAEAQAAGIRAAMGSQP